MLGKGSNGGRFIPGKSVVFLQICLTRQFWPLSSQTCACLHCAIADAVNVPKSKHAIPIELLFM
jgi:hypothetical protein